MKRTTCLLFLVLLFLVLCFLYGIAPATPDAAFFTIVLLIVFLGVCILSISKESNSLINGNFFTLSKIFSLGFVVVFFQIPIEYIIGISNDKYSDYFFDNALITKSICFSAICLIVFYVGYFVLNDEKNQKRVFHHASTGLLIAVAYFMLFAYLMTIDPAYLNGGYAKVDVSPAAERFWGYLNRFAILAYIQCLINARLRDNNIKITVFQYLAQFPKFLWVLLLIIVLLVLLSGSRADAISMITLIGFGFFVLCRKKLKMFPFLIFICCGGFLLSIFKFLGGISNGTTEHITASVEYFSNTRMDSISPYTVELASSIYANNILFYLWDQGICLYSVTAIKAILMSIPGAVTIFLNVTGLELDRIDTGVLASNVAGTSYSVGSTCIGNALLDFGFIGAIVCFFIWGVLFRKMDCAVFSNQKCDNFYFVFGLITMSEVLFMTRGSLFSTIGFALFGYLVLKLNYYLVSKY